MEAEGYDLVRWELSQTLKVDGGRGLNIDNLRLGNEALLTKWL